MKNNYIISKINYIRCSPQKIRLFSKLYQKKYILEVIEELKLLNTKLALILKKGLISVMNNGIHNYHLDINIMKIDQIIVNKGPSYKRILPRAKGKIDYIHKPTSNIKFIILKNGTKSKS